MVKIPQNIVTETLKNLWFCVLVWKENILKMKFFDNDDDNHVISLPEFSSKKSKITCDYCVFKFLTRGMDGNNSLRFQSVTSVLKSLRRSVVEHI